MSDRLLQIEERDRIVRREESIDGLHTCQWKRYVGAFCTCDFRFKKRAKRLHYRLWCLLLKA